jgi:hypothetical protein
MKVLYLLGISLLCFSSLSAQKDIEGLWEGTITFGGIQVMPGPPSSGRCCDADHACGVMMLTSLLALNE